MGRIRRWSIGAAIAGLLCASCLGCLPSSEASCVDEDGDGYGDPRSDLEGCDQAGADCDDRDPGVHPGAWEGCDLRDTDCDGVLAPDEVDADGDGFASCRGDCDDADAATYPGAAEICDGIDNDCDGAPGADELDGDGDGAPACGAAGQDPDCDDTDPGVHPGAADVCDGVADNDCDGQTDPQELDADGDGASGCDGDCDDESADLNPWDGDGDGFSPCELDCDDADPGVHPGAADACDGVADNDCDGQPDPGEADADGDGTSLCEGDCDDADPAAYPGAPEICLDGIDQDCDGVDLPVLSGELGFCLDGEYVGAIAEPALVTAPLAAYGNSGEFGDDPTSGLVDNVRVVVDGLIAFDEDFEGDLGAWLPFGDPASGLVPLGNPGFALMTAGDACGPSGAWTAQPFAWSSVSWSVSADMRIAAADPNHNAIVALMDGTVPDPCGGQMPSAVVQASYAGVDNVLRFAVAGVDTLAVPDPGLGVWHGVTIVRP